MTGEPVEQSRADDDAVRRDLAADQRADLAERPLVEQAVEAGAGIEFALVVVLGESLGATHRPGVVAATLEVVERVLPVLRLRHGCHPHRWVPVPSAVLALTILNCLL
jgi:hypothetical protein